MIDDFSSVLVVIDTNQPHSRRADSIASRSERDTNRANAGSRLNRSSGLFSSHDGNYHYHHHHDYGDGSGGYEEDNMEEEEEDVSLEFGTNGAEELDATRFLNYDDSDSIESTLLGSARRATPNTSWIVFALFPHAGSTAKSRFSSCPNFQTGPKYGSSSHSGSGGNGADDNEGEDIEYSHIARLRRRCSLLRDVIEKVRPLVIVTFGNWATRVLELHCEVPRDESSRIYTPWTDRTLWSAWSHHPRHFLLGSWIHCWWIRAQSQDMRALRMLPEDKRIISRHTDNNALARSLTVALSSVEGKNAIQYIRRQLPGSRPQCHATIVKPLTRANRPIVEFIRATDRYPLRLGGEHAGRRFDKFDPRDVMDYIEARYRGASVFTMQITHPSYDEATNRIELFGRNQDGLSCLIHIINFTLHFKFSIRDPVANARLDVPKFEKILRSAYKKALQEKYVPALVRAHLSVFSATRMTSRPFDHYHLEEVPMVKVTFSRLDTGKMVRETIEKLLGAGSCAYYDTSTCISPLEAYSLESGISNHSFVDVDLSLLPSPYSRPTCDVSHPGSVSQMSAEQAREVDSFYANRPRFLREASKLSWCDSELILSSPALCKLPAEPPKQDFPITCASLDCEVLSSQGDIFPISSLDPCICIVVWFQTYLPTTKREVVHNPADTKDESSTKMSGRTDYDHVVAFSFGDTPDYAHDGFSSRFLPLAPKLDPFSEKTPKEKIYAILEKVQTLPISKDALSTSCNEKEAETFCVAYFEAQKWCEQFAAWIRFVGMTRFLTDCRVQPLGSSSSLFATALSATSSSSSSSNHRVQEEGAPRCANDHVIGASSFQCLSETDRSFWKEGLGYENPGEWVLHVAKDFPSMKSMRESGNFALAARSLLAIYKFHALWAWRGKRRLERGPCTCEWCSSSDKELVRGSVEWNWERYRPQSHVRSYSTEREMLEDFMRYCRLMRFDIYSGYNLAFDMDYIDSRAFQVGARVKELAPYDQNWLSKVKRAKVGISMLKDKSNQRGVSMIKKIALPGSDMLCVYRYMVRQVTMSSYQLNDVSEKDLGEHKEDVPYEVIPELFERDMARLVKYCEKDALLPLRINEVNSILALSLLMAHVIGLQMTLGDLFDKGQKARVLPIRNKHMLKMKQKFVIPERFAPRSSSGNWNKGSGSSGKRLRPEWSKSAWFEKKTKTHRRGWASGFRNAGHYLGYDSEESSEDEWDDEDDLSDLNISDAVNSARSAFVATTIASSNKKDDGKRKGPGFEGGLNPKAVAGFYLLPVGLPDFEGLYPSIMREKNLSNNTLVYMGQMIELMKKYPDVEGETWEQKVIRHGFIRSLVAVPVAEQYRYSGDLPPGMTLREPMSKKALEKIAKKERANKRRKFTANQHHDIRSFFPEKDTETTLPFKNAPRSLYEDNRTEEFVFFDQKEPAVDSSMLEVVIGHRNIAKGEAAKHAKSTIEYKNNDLLQLIWKVVANSDYGVQDPAIAATVTSFGRYYLLRVIDIVTQDGDVLVLYGDTDSIFQAWTKNPGTNITEKMDYAWKHLIEDVAKVNATLKKPMNLQVEAILWPSIFLGQKMYIFKTYIPEWNEALNRKCLPKDGAVKFKGLSNVRRGVAPIVKQAVEEFAKRIVSPPGGPDAVGSSESLWSAFSYIRGLIVSLLEGAIPIEKLIQSSCIKSDTYSKGANVPVHVALDRKKQARKEQATPIGQRIAYVFCTHVNVDIKGKNVKKAKKGERVEDPVYAFTHNLQIDYAYYVERIEKPITKIFSVIMENEASFNTARAYMFDPNASSGARMDYELHTYTEPVTYRHLLRMVPKIRAARARTRVRYTENIPIGGLPANSSMGFAKNAPRILCCSKCGKLVSESFGHVFHEDSMKNELDAWKEESLVCATCAPLPRWRAKQKALQDRTASRLSECRACLAIDESVPVACKATTCSKFFPRLAAVKANSRFSEELQRIEELLDALEITADDKCDSHPSLDPMIE